MIPEALLDYLDVLSHRMREQQLGNHLENLENSRHSETLNAVTNDHHQTI